MDMLRHFRDIRRIVILGHTGFIGSRAEAYFRTQLPVLEIVGRSFPELDLTIEEDTHSLRDLFEPHTAVLMCAAIKRQVGDNLDAFSQNLKMAVNLCRLLEDHPVGRFVYFSSAAVYGEDIHNTNITEETPVHPTSYYGAAKYASECLLRRVIPQKDNSTLLILRPATVYGPGEPARSYSPSGFLKAALHGEQITLWGDGQERREFVFIDDLVELTFGLTFDERQGVLNIVTGDSHSFIEAIEILARLGYPRIRPTSKPRTKSKVDHGFSNHALRKVFPRFAFTTLEEGMRRTLEVESSVIQPDSPKVGAKST